MEVSCPKSFTGLGGQDGPNYPVEGYSPGERLSNKRFLKPKSPTATRVTPILPSLGVSSTIFRKTFKTGEPYPFFRRKGAGAGAGGVEKNDPGAIGKGHGTVEGPV